MQEELRLHDDFLRMFTIMQAPKVLVVFISFIFLFMVGFLWGDIFASTEPRIIVLKLGRYKSTNIFIHLFMV